MFASSLDHMSGGYAGHCLLHWLGLTREHWPMKQDKFKRCVFSEPRDASFYRMQKRALIAELFKFVDEVFVAF